MYCSLPRKATDTFLTNQICTPLHTQARLGIPILVFNGRTTGRDLTAATVMPRVQIWEGEPYESKGFCTVVRCEGWGTGALK